MGDTCNPLAASTYRRSRTVDLMTGKVHQGPPSSYGTNPYGTPYSMVNIVRLSWHDACPLG